MDNNKLRVSNGSGEAVRALVTTLRTAGSTVINLNTLVNWPTANGFVATTGPLLADGTLDPTKTLVFLGHISGSTIIIDSLAPGYADTNGNSVGDVVVIKPNTWWADQMASAAESMATFITQQGDWRAVGTTISSLTYNGNRSYTAVLAADKSATLSPKQRLRLTSSTPNPTQSASLNGTTQYFSKSAPAGMTFTDDFVLGAWVKVGAYQSSHIISRYNGTSGWALFMDGTGQVGTVGFNAGSGNFKGVRSWQSVPLNKWVHISVQADLSTATTTATTNYVMVDGIDVPSAIFQGGTNPTALVQAGNLEIGGSNGGLQPFSGKITQAFVTVAKLTQTQVRAIYSQGITTADTATYGMASAFSLSGSTTDLNTTNANNLTASGAATTTNADSFSGYQADGSISSTKNYGIIQKISGTSVTFQVPEGNTVPTVGTVAMEYSPMTAPYGFPGEEGKWLLEVIFLLNLSKTAPAANTWYNIAGAQITLPVGSHTLMYKGSMYNNSGATVSVGLSNMSLTAASGTYVTSKLSAVAYTAAGSLISVHMGKDNITTTAQTVVYVNNRIDVAATAIEWYSPTPASTLPTGGLFIEAKNAYL